MNGVKISNKDVDFFKGISILCIMMHNFLHLFPFPRENEMDFDSERFIHLLNIFMYHQDAIVRGVFSYFGHFGVQFFIFFSAYGLTKKYMFSPVPKTIIFLYERIMKLYPMFISAIIFYLLYVGILPSILHGRDFFDFLSDIYKPLLLKLTLLWNLYPGQGFSLVGPWWFLSMIFQFYIIFPLLIKIFRKYKNIGLLIIALISYLIIFVTQGYFGSVSVFFTVIGHLPLFCLGIYFAQYDEIRIKKEVIFIALIVFSLSNIYKPLFFVSHMSFFILSFSVFLWIKSHLNDYMIKFFVYFGTISFPLFLINAFFRYPLLTIAMKYNNELLSIIFCILFIIQCVVGYKLLTLFNKFCITPLFLIIDRNIKCIFKME